MSEIGSEIGSLDGRAGNGGFGLALGTLATLAFVVVGFLSILWTPYSPASFDVGSALQDPGGAHWLGTDPLGRDVLSLLMKSILTSLVVAIVAVVVGALIGVPLGLLAVRWPGFGDRAGGGLSGLLSLFPPLIVALVLATNFGGSAVVSMVAIGVGAIAPLAGVTRASVRNFGARAYLEAARLAGFSRWEAIRRHALPQIVRAIAANAAALLGAGILWEATLSYLGLGSQPPAASLGLVLHDAQGYLASRPLLVVIPGLTLLLMIVALRLLAWGIRREPRAGEPRGAA